MRKLIEATLVTLDGVVESPWEWAGTHFGDENKRNSLAELQQADTFLLGRGTYEKFVATWPHVTGDPYIEHINQMRKLVASTTLREVTWNASIIEGDVAAALAELKRQPGRNIIKYGTGGLTRTLVEHRLIDEFHICVLPVVRGRGQRLFECVDPGRLSLRLVRTQAFESGSVTLTYVPNYD
jgi:dihydrofolate reductase